MTPAQMVDMHLDLAERLKDHRFRASITNAYQLDREQMHTYDEARSILTEGDTPGHRQAEYMFARFNAHVQEAHNFYVTKDMGKLLGWATASLEGTDKIDLSLAPTRSGMVRFEEPILIKEVRGRTMKAHWLLWGPVEVDMGGVVGEATMLTWFNDGEDPDEVILDDVESNFTPKQLEMMNLILGRWMWVGVDVITQDQRLGPQSVVVDEWTRSRVLADGGVPADEGDNMIRYAHALWLMLGQTITVSRDAMLDRATARRAKKKNLPSKVTVVSLRRAVYDDEVKREGETEVQWQHRWIVRGHWRWQHVGPHHPLAQEIAPGDYRARLWIAPFVKGPEGAPLHESAKVYALKR